MTGQVFVGSSGLAVGLSGFSCNLETSTNLVVICQQGSIKTGSLSSGLDPSYGSSKMIYFTQANPGMWRSAQQARLHATEGRCAA